MKLAVFLELMNEYGDAYVVYISPISRKEKFVVATADFNNKYIKTKPRPPRTNKLDAHKVLLFCWDTDSWKVLDARDITKVSSLSAELERSSQR
jgi:hypothetical protein